jgi:predicted nucleic acid-binding protein
VILVADSSALIALSLCSALQFLDVLFGEVKVPPGVFDEIVKEELIDYALELAGEG